MTHLKFACSTLVVIALAAPPILAETPPKTADVPSDQVSNNFSCSNLKLAFPFISNGDVRTSVSGFCSSSLQVDSWRLTLILHGTTQQLNVRGSADYHSSGSVVSFNHMSHSLTVSCRNAKWEAGLELRATLQNGNPEVAINGFYTSPKVSISCNQQLIGQLLQVERTDVENQQLLLDFCPSSGSLTHCSALCSVIGNLSHSLPLLLQTELDFPMKLGMSGSSSKARNECPRPPLSSVEPCWDNRILAYSSGLGQQRHDHFFERSTVGRC